MVEYDGWAIKSELFTLTRKGGILFKTADKEMMKVVLFQMVYGSDRFQFWTEFKKLSEDMELMVGRRFVNGSVERKYLNIEEFYFKEFV